jgi:hypothetical protein
MKKREERIRRINAVVREYRSGLVAIRILNERMAADPSLMSRENLFHIDFRNFQANLEATYFIRVFAEFESSLRDVWKSTGRDTHPRLGDLLDAMASRRRISHYVNQAVHSIRRYRNSLVHEESTEAPPISFSVTIRNLTQFLSYLPPDC